MAALLAAGALAASAATQARAGVSAGRCVPAHLNGSAALGGSGLVASPLPGSRDASAHTQISLLGVPASALRRLRVSGSQTGSHPGRLEAYSQGDGASFLPARPFRPGETVSVHGRVRVGASSVPFGFAFAVAYADPPPHVREPHAIRDPDEKQHYSSQPKLEPPAIVVTARSSATAPGYMFATPYNGPGASGPMIFDEAGSVVWFDPLPAGTEATNLQVQQLEGRPVLTWWQGYIPREGFGEGEEIIDNSAYQVIGRVHAGNGFSVDLHDFHIGPQATALITVFSPIYCDLAAVGGPAAGAVTDTGFQEIDLRTGLVRREWHSLDHVALGDSYASPRGASGEWPDDYFHINSLQQLPNGRTLISARNTWALYELDTRSGRLLSAIGGKHSTVKLTAGAATAFQHDATQLPDGTIAIFDNGALPKVHAQSRALLLELDAATDTASVLAQFVHPSPLLAGSQGNVQLLENRDVFIGWGAQPYFSEFSPSGQLLFDAHMHGSYQSYRTYRFPWTGAPAAPPAIAASRANTTAPVTVYASWNGDTRTAAWRLFAGPAPGQLTPVAAAPRAGFETALSTPAPAAYVAVQALDAGGAVLGTSATVAG